MRPNSLQIEAVAEWWAVRTFDKFLNQNNGDDSPNGGMAFALMNMVSHAAREKTGSEKREPFKAAIIKSLSKDQETHHLSLDVDYNPNKTLLAICVESGVDTGMLPCKTFTQWDRQENCFMGRYQYGGAWEKIGKEV